MGMSEEEKYQRYKTWIIRSQDVLTALQSAGYYTERAPIDGEWYYTDCYLITNSRFALPDGRMLYSVGTALEFLTPDEEKQRAEEKRQVYLSYYGEEREEMTIWGSSVYPFNKVTSFK